MIFVPLAGLPRSGSTLLLNILGQNPEITVGPTSGLLETMLLIRNNWENNQLHKTLAADISKEKLRRVLKGVLESYSMGKVVFDKNRAWLDHIEMLEWVLGKPVSVIITLRDQREILASFEKIWRKNKGFRQIPQEVNNNFQTIRDRCNVWLDPQQPLGFAIRAIKDAELRGHKMFTVNYDNLIKFPEATLLSIYTYLQIPYFKHDFNNIEQIIYENDEIHRMTGLHDIKSTISRGSSWQEILGDDYQ